MNIKQHFHSYQILTGMITNSSPFHKNNMAYSLQNPKPWWRLISLTADISGGKEKHQKIQKSDDTIQNAYNN